LVNVIARSRRRTGGRNLYQIFTLSGAAVDREAAAMGSNSNQIFRRPIIV